MTWSGTNHARHTILVVDDEPATRMALADILSQEGAEIVTAASGVEALQIVTALVPCLAIVDVMMPGTDGLSLVRQIKARPNSAHLPVMFISGDPERIDFADAVVRDAVDFIRKPFDLAEIRFRTRAQLRWHETVSAREQSAQTLAAISGAAMDTIIVLDDRGSVCHWNAAAQAMFGYPADEILGKTLSPPLFPTELRSSDQEQVELFCRAEPTQLLGKISKLWARHKSGATFPVEMSLTATEIQGRSLAIAIVRDMTAIRRVEDELAVQNALLRAQQEVAPDGILAVRESGEILSFNRQFQRMWGIPDDVLAARSDEAALASVVDKLVDPHSFIEKVSHLYAHPAETTHDELALKDGRTFERYSAPMVQDDGVHLGRVWYFRDVTARKDAEEALRLSEQKYRAHFAAASVGQALTALDGRIMDVNAAFAHMLGYEPSELRGLSFAKLTHPDDVDRSMSARQEILERGGEADRFEKRYVCKDGRTIWVDLSLTALRDPEGRPQYFVAHVIDITDRRRMEERLRDEEAERKRMEVELRHSQKLEAVGQLAAGIAHEINTPTQFVGDSIGFIKQAWDGLGQVVPKYREVARTLVAQTNDVRLGNEIGSLEQSIDLEYLLTRVPKAFDRSFDGVARISNIVRAMKEFAHPGHHDKHPSDLNQALKNTLTIARNEYKYVADVETQFGEIPLVVCQLADINQVFLNLIVNAAHAISDVVGPNHTRGTIRIGTERDGDGVRIDIADTGAGISDAIKDRVFEPFFTTKPVGRGTGQGLAIARAIVVDRHGGTLTFESKVGVGTTFTMRLPIDASGSGEVAQP